MLNGSRMDAPKFSDLIGVQVKFLLWAQRCCATDPALSFHLALGISLIHC